MKMMNFPQHYGIVTILPEEWVFIQRIGEKRKNNARSKGYQDMADKSVKNRDILGFAAEYAVALFYTNWVHTKIPDDFTDERFDSFWVKPYFQEMQKADVGTVIEMKSSDYREKQLWNLVVNQNQLRDDRAYVNALTAWLPEQIIITGWAWGSEIREHARLAQNRAKGHPILIYSHERLHEPLKLFNFLR